MHLDSPDDKLKLTFSKHKNSASFLPLANDVEFIHEHLSSFTRTQVKKEISCEIKLKNHVFDFDFDSNVIVHYISILSNLSFVIAIFNSNQWGSSLI